MEDSEIISYLKRSYTETPRAEWVLRTRQMLEARTRQHVPLPSHAFSTFWQKISFPRLILPVTFAAGMLIFLGMSVLASRTALPSSFLYPLKLAYESTKGVLALSHQQQADHSLMIAEVRVQELAELSRNAHESRDEKPKTEIINRTVSRYTDALSQSSRTMKQLKAEGKTDLAREAAGKLEKTARAYTALLSTFDTTTSSLAVMQNARSASEEAKAAAEEILAVPDGSVPSSSSVEVGVSPSISPSPEPSLLPEASSTSTPLSSPSASPSGEPAPETPYPTSPMPNVVE